MHSWYSDCEKLPVWSYEKGDKLIQEDMKDPKLFILKSGSVEVRRRDLTMATIANRGAVFGEVSLLLDQPATASVVALEPSEFFVAEDGARFIADHPDLNLFIARLMARRLTNATELALDLYEQLQIHEDLSTPAGGVLRSLADQLTGSF